jgi:hypothetical protein
VSERHYPDDCGKCLEVWGARESQLLDQIAEMRKVLQAARPFIATEARLVNYGVGHPGNGEAPAVLEAINEALRGGTRQLSRRIPGPEPEAMSPNKEREQS